jgi:mono/diheme cytochrome c family protein
VTAIAFGRKARLVGPRPAGRIGLVLALLSGLACDRPPSADSLTEWTPADHHSTDDDKRGQEAQGAQQSPPRQAAAAVVKRAPRAQAAAQTPAQAGGTGAPEATSAGAGEGAQLADLAWRQQCSTCHGATGRGDGQLGPMVRAPDLTREDWQSRVTDAEIAATIKHGKGKMPNFDVPDSVIEGLVARVRAARGR